MSNTPVIVAEELQKTFKEAKLTTQVLLEVNLRLMPGEKVAIVGASGSGKSTLLHLLGGLDRPSGGRIELMGTDLSKLGQDRLTALRERYLGFVYQFHHLLPEFTALENVMLPLALRKMPLLAAKAKAEAMLSQVGLTQRSQHRPSELSGGERQRVAIARALVKNPACIMADEPTGNLDKKNREEVWQLFLDLNQATQAALIVVTHDERLTQDMDRVLVLEEGRLLT